MNAYKYIFPAALLILITGCTLFRPAERSETPADAPKTFTLYTEAPQPINDFWWTSFNDPELTGLIETALDSSFDLRVAYARLKQARAYAKISAADLFPDLNLNAGFDHKKTETKGSSAGASTSNTLSLGFAAGYEIDLWGKIRSQKTADSLYMEESRESYRTASMTVASEIATTWIDIIATRKAMIFARETLQTNESLLKIIELRFENSQASALDLLQQRQGVAAARAVLPPLEAQEKVLLNKLALLSGKAVPKPEQIKTDLLPDLPPLPSTGLPADLLSNRPDVRAAGLRLKAADWEVSAARAARLPAISLSASGVWSSTEASDLFDNWIANLAANLTGPIFDAGKRKSAVKRARAIAEERLATYEKTVIASIHEVENGLINEDRQAAYLEALKREREAADQALKEATRRYFAGQISFITLQDRLLKVQSLDGTLIRQHAALLKYRIALYRALGGGWQLSESEKEDRLPEILSGVTPSKNNPKKSQ